MELALNIFCVLLWSGWAIAVFNDILLGKGMQFILCILAVFYFLGEIVE